MILIDIGRVTDALDSIEELEKKADRMYMEIGQTSAQLQNLSGMLQVRKKLEDIMEEVKVEHLLLEQMNRCLEVSCRAYMRNEENITEYAEETSVSGYQEPKLEAVSIPQAFFQLLR